jgi:hypothetical protein
MRARNVFAMITALSGCVSTAASAEPNSAPPPARPSVIIAVTTQLRGSLSTLSLDPDGPPSGALHIAKLLRDLRADHPDLILLDTGNVLTGAPDAPRTAPPEAPPILRVLNALHFDAAILGDRDLAASPAEFSTALRDTTFPWIAANVSVSEASALVRSVVVEREGLRIGIIGLVAPAALLGIEPTRRAALHVTDVESATRAEVLRLRRDGHADLVIAVGAGAASDDADREAGWLENLPQPNAAGRIADTVPALDLVIAGRARFPRRGEVARPNRSYRVPLVEPVPSARSVTLLRLDLAGVPGTWHIASLAQETRGVGPETDSASVALVADELARSRTEFAQPLPLYISGRSTKRTLQACTGAIAHTAALRAGESLAPTYAHRTGAALSLLPTPTSLPRYFVRDVGHAFTRGEITRWFVRDDALVRTELSGRQIAELLEPYVRAQHGWRSPPAMIVAPGGLDLTLAPRRSEAMTMRLAGTSDTIVPGATYAVWLARYHRFGGAGLAARVLLASDAPAIPAPRTLRDAVLDLLADAAAPLPSECANLLARTPPVKSPKSRRARRVSAAMMRDDIVSASQPAVPR